MPRDDKQQPPRPRRTITRILIAIAVVALVVWLVLLIRLLGPHLVGALA